MEILNTLLGKNKEVYPFGKNNWVINTVSRKLGKAGKKFILMTINQNNNAISETGCVFVNELAIPDSADQDKYIKTTPNTISLWYISCTKLVEKEFAQEILNSLP